MMPEDFEARIVLALKDHGGPPELAPQLCAIADNYNLSNALENWIRWHRLPEWSAMQFETWCNKYWDSYHRLENCTRDNR